MHTHTHTQSHTHRGTHTHTQYTHTHLIKSLHHLEYVRGVDLLPSTHPPLTKALFRRDVLEHLRIQNRHLTSDLNRAQYLEPYFRPVDHGNGVHDLDGKNRSWCDNFGYRHATFCWRRQDSLRFWIFLDSNRFILKFSRLCRVTLSIFQFQRKL